MKLLYNNIVICNVIYIIIIIELYHTLLEHILNHCWSLKLTFQII